MQNIRNYEAMAKLELSEEELKTVAEYVSMFEQSFSQLAEQEIPDTEPLVSVLDINNVFREDIAVKKFSREEFLENAPERRDGYFSVSG